MESAELPVHTSDSSRTPLRIAAPFLVFVISVACFLPAQRNGFVNWDDNGNFLTNTEYQTLSWPSLKWALTTRHMGHYQPLNWLTFIADHAVAGTLGPAGPTADDDPYLRKMRPDHWPTHPPSAGRFHQTQAILHGVAAVLVYFLALGLLRPSPIGPWLSVFAALFFAVHPLRVESVAWASARTDVLAAMFMLSATIVYLRGFTDCPGWVPMAGSRFVVALLMALAVSSKVMAITLPVVLLILDVYVGRVWIAAGSNAPGAIVSRITRLVLQKSELIALSIAGIWVARWAHSDAIVDLRMHGVSNRIAQVFVSLAFYPFKTIWPTDFSPLYEFPARFGWSHSHVLIATVIVVATAIIMLRYRPYRGVIAAFSAYFVLIAPVSGLTQRGTQMVADRYSYIACIPLALIAASLLGGCVSRYGRPSAIAGSLVLILLIIQTQRQIAYWHDSKALWDRAIELDPTNATAYAAMGSVYNSIGDPQRAIRFYEKAVSIRHQQFGAWFALGNLNRDLGDDENAVRSYRTELEFNPTHAPSQVQLCLALARLGRLSEAEPVLRRLRDNPAKADDTMIRHMLADACAERGDLDEAILLIDEALKIAQEKNRPAVVEALLATRADYESVRNAPPMVDPSPTSRPDSQPGSPG